MGNEAPPRGVAAPSGKGPGTPLTSPTATLATLPSAVGAERFVLPPGQSPVQLCWSRTDVGPGTLEALRADLDEATLARSERMVRPADASRVVVAHALLRRTLGTRFGIAPRAVHMTRRCDRCGRYGDPEHGRPVVIPPDGTAAPELSLSHAGRLAVIAVSEPGQPVGVDVEAPRLVREWRDGLTHLLTPVERWITSGAPDDRGLLARAWTGKEAVAKATGRGLGDDTGEIEVLGAPCADPGRVWWRTRATPTTTAALLTFPTLDPESQPPHHVALAVLVDPIAQPTPSDSQASGAVPGPT